MASNLAIQIEARNHEQIYPSRMNTVRRRPLNLAPITTNSGTFQRFQNSSFRQEPLTGSTSRSSLDTGSIFDVSPRTSTEPRGYQNHQKNSASGYDSQTIRRSDGTKELFETAPNVRHSRQQSRWADLFHAQRTSPNLGHEQENRHTMPVAPTHYRIPERMLSPTAVSPQRRGTVSRLEDLSEVQHVRESETLRPRIGQTYTRSAINMQHFEEAAPAHTTNDFPGPLSTNMGFDNNIMSMNPCSAPFLRGYINGTIEDYTLYSRGNPDIRQGRLRRTIGEDDQTTSRFENATAPFHQPSYGMAMTPENPQPTQQANPWDDMVMCQPALNPSNMLLRRQGALPPIPAGSIQGPPILHYGGQLGGGPEYEEERVPDNENCSLWITNMEPSVTAREFFQMVRCGGVYALHIYPPTGEHRTAAAKLIFKRPSSAAIFLQHASSQAGLHPHNRRLKVMYNRNGVREYSGSKTRVLRVMGPSHEMIFNVWDAYFKNLCVFEYDEVVFPECHMQGQSIIEFRFMRIDAQAQMIQKEIVDNPQLQRFNAYFSPDPCGR
ncbi:hypothetical protein HYFRA_00002454 [Hymenoscyphus fraxineus]|uniref:RRM domain-containing protein n=1 Tax=Hymenoscyphus fraxineus TaxID=746836 RepID=A0A9N9L9D6_9HELO|nr:hypothetical protein HYFRA_00002454 [Hymenoscyphus fraxineus]